MPILDNKSITFFIALFIVLCLNSQAQVNYVITKHDSIWSLTKTNGQRIISFNYDEAFLAEDAACIIIYDKGKFGVIDFTGKFIIPLQDNPIYYLSPKSILIKGLSDKTIISDPVNNPMTTVLDSLSEFLFIKKENSFGILDYKNRNFIKPAYASIRPIRENIYILEKDDKEYLYDSFTGKLSSQGWRAISFFDEQNGVIMAIDNEHAALYNCITHQWTHFNNAKLFIKNGNEFIIRYQDHSEVYNLSENKILNCPKNNLDTALNTYYFQKEGSGMLYTRKSDHFDSLQFDSFIKSGANFIINLGKNAYLANSNGEIVLSQLNGEILATRQKDIFHFKNSKGEIKYIFVDDLGQIAEEKTLKISIKKKPTESEGAFFRNTANDLVIAKPYFIDTKLKVNYVKQNGDTVFLKSDFNFDFFKPSFTPYIHRIGKFVRATRENPAYFRYGLFNTANEKLMAGYNYRSFFIIPEITELIFGFNLDGEIDVYNTDGVKKLSHAKDLGKFSDGMISFNIKGHYKISAYEKVYEDGIEVNINQNQATYVFAALLSLSAVEMQKINNRAAYIEISEGLWGFLNASGDITIKPQYKWVSPFIQGQAIVQNLNGYFGVINKDNDIIIPFEYASIERIIKGNSITFKTLKYCAKSGYLIKDKYFTPFDYDRAYSFNQGISIVSKNRKFGIMHSNGDLASEIAYKKLGKYSHGFISFKDKNNLWGYINKTGNIVIEPKYLEVKDFSADGLAFVKPKNLFQVIDTSDSVLIQPRFKYNQMFVNGIAPVSITGEEWGLINTEGKWMKRPKYKLIKNNSNDDDTSFAIQMEHNWYLMDNQFKLNNDTLYKRIDKFSESLAAVYNEKHCGYIDRQGKLVIPMKFEFCGCFANNRARVRIGKSKTHFINTQGKIIDNNGYDYAEDFKFNYAVVQQKGHYALIYTNSAIISLSYIRIQEHNRHGFCRTAENGKLTFMSKNSNKLLQIGGIKGLMAYEGKFPVARHKSYINKSLALEWALFNPFGFAVTDFCFSNVSKISEGNRILKLKYLVGLFDNNGHSLIENECLHISDVQNSDLFYVCKPNEIAYYNIIEKKWIK